MENNYLVFKRGTVHYKNSVKRADFYKYYKNNFNGTQSNKKVDLVTKFVFDKIFEKIIYSGYEFKLPGFMGTLRIRKSKPKVFIDKNGKVDSHKLPINWNATRKLWREMYGNISNEDLKKIEGKPKIKELNKHTGGYACHFFWDKTISKFKNKTLYYCEFARGRKEELARGLKEVKGLINIYYQ